MNPGWLHRLARTARTTLSTVRGTLTQQIHRHTTRTQQSSISASTSLDSAEESSSVLLLRLQQRMREEEEDYRMIRESLGLEEPTDTSTPPPPYDLVVLRGGLPSYEEACSGQYPPSYDHSQLDPPPPYTNQ